MKLTKPSGLVSQSVCPYVCPPPVQAQCRLDTNSWGQHQLVGVDIHSIPFPSSFSHPAFHSFKFF